MHFVIMTGLAAEFLPRYWGSVMELMVLVRAIIPSNKAGLAFPGALHRFWALATLWLCNSMETELFLSLGVSWAWSGRKSLCYSLWNLSFFHSSRRDQPGLGGKISVIPFMELEFFLSLKARWALRD